MPCTSRRWRPRPRLPCSRWDARTACTCRNCKGRSGCPDIAPAAASSSPRRRLATFAAAEPPEGRRRALATICAAKYLPISQPWRLGRSLLLFGDEPCLGHQLSIERVVFLEE